MARAGATGKHIPDQQVGGLGVANFVSRLYRPVAGRAVYLQSAGRILSRIAGSGADKIGVLGLDDLSGTEIGGLADLYSYLTKAVCGRPDGALSESDPVPHSDHSLMMLPQEPVSRQRNQNSRPRSLTLRHLADDWPTIRPAIDNVFDDARRKLASRHGRTSEADLRIRKAINPQPSGSYSLRGRDTSPRSI